MPVGYRADEAGQLVTRWLNHFELSSHKRGTEISRLQPPDARIIYVSSGAVGTFVQSDGAERLVGIAHKGGLISQFRQVAGHSALVIKALRRTNVYVASYHHLRDAIPREALNDLILGSSLYVQNVLINYALAANIRQIEARIIKVLADAKLAQDHEVPDANFEVEWGIRQAEFASLVGVARPYLNRVLKGMQDAGTLRINGDQITVKAASQPYLGTAQ